MAGGGGDEAPPSAAEKKGKKKKKRVGVRMDMTPMVDVAFLLLTFFMLTSVFNTPQTMEINLPPSDVKVEVAQTSLMIMRVMENGKIYWNLAEQPIDVVEYKGVGKLMREQNAANPKLVTLIKVDRKAKYHHMVDMMDELQLENVNRFSLAKLDDPDLKEVLKFDPTATTSQPTGEAPAPK